MQQQADDIGMNMAMVNSLNIVDELPDLMNPDSYMNIEVITCTQKSPSPPPIGFF